MKGKIWKIGVGLTFFLCGLQFLSGVGDNAGVDAFTIESQAAKRPTVYCMKKNYYYLDEEQGSYVFHPTETEVAYYSSGTIVDVTYHITSGYQFKKMVLNNVYECYESMACLMNGHATIDIYFDPLPMHPQTYRYYVYDPIKESYVLTMTRVEQAREGKTYAAKLELPEQGYQVQEIHLNGQKTTLLSDFTYFITGSGSIDVYLYPSQTTLQFYDETGNQVASQIVYWGKRQKLIANPLKKQWYEFAGWKTVIDGEETVLADQEEFETPYPQDKATLRLTAQWEPLIRTVSLGYHAKEDQKEVFLSQQYEWGEELLLKNQEAIPDPMENALLSGWKLQPEGKEAVFASGERMSVETLYSRAIELGVIDAEEKEPVIDLYPIWDRQPVFKTTHLYILQKDALAGKITREYLLKELGVVDPEDGSLKLLTEGGSTSAGVRFTNYEAGLFQNGQAGEVTLSVEARDSGGNSIAKQVVCTIVETDGTYLGKSRRVRFISEEYVNTLAEDSIWNCLEEYRQLLEETLEKARCVCTSLF